MRGLNKPETDSVTLVGIAFWKGSSMKDRKIPIVLVGFGTTTAAVDTYSFIGSRIKGRFRIIRSNGHIRQGWCGILAGRETTLI